MHKNREPDISSLLHGLWKSNVQVVVSKTNFKEQSLSHFILNEDIELVKNKMGIPEPMDAKETSIDHVEVILIPLLVSDKNGYRIGYGGGYYDRLLAETKAMKVGLSLSPPVDRIIQIEKWDVPLDYLITPFKTYKYG
jgi:5-formyltetrahydrofolate cyclo-ligase